jgi:phage protein D
LPSDNRSEVRAPRLRVKANGVEFAAYSAEVIQNHNHANDTFQVSLPLFDPKAPKDWTYWADESDIEIEIAIGFADAAGHVGSWTVLITGPLEAPAMAPLSYGYHSSPNKGRAAIGAGGMIGQEGGPAHPAGAVLTLQGTDYSATLAQSPLAQQFTGGSVTLQQVLDQIQAHHPQLQFQLADGGDDIGDPYDQQQGRLFLNRSEWDVLTALADHEGYRVTVKGRKITIGPGGQADAGNPYALYYRRGALSADGLMYLPPESNCITLRLARKLSVAKGVDSFVQSYDSATGRRLSRKASARSSRRANRATSGQSANGLIYTDNIPGMTDTQAKKHAQKKAGQIAQFEREIAFQIPGDLSLTVDRMVSLSGTGTAYDQAYEIDQLVHQFDMQRGYAIEGRARNKSSDVTVSDAA